MLEDPDHIALNHLHLNPENCLFAVNTEANNQAENIQEEPEKIHLQEMMERYESKVINRALQQCGHNIKQAAVKLGIPRSTLQYKIKKYALSSQEGPKQMNNHTCTE